VNRGNEGGPDAPLARRPGLGRVAGRTAIVVGGGSSGPGIGNGRAIAIVLAREGASVVVVDIDGGSAKRTVELIEAENGVASAVAADATSDAACRSVVESTVARYGSVDILVNSLGVMGPPASVVDIDPGVWDDILRVNLKPIMLMSRYAIPAMIGGGAIVNTSSVAGIRETDRAAYATAKAAITGLTTTMAGQHGPAGVRVNAVSPGAVWTPFVTNEVPDDEKLRRLREERRLGNLLQTEGTAWDTAYAALFLASDESRWITGQTLVVDAGMTSSYRKGPR
jgi:NAD(P)-dependent dehydrogenase (short-subunit alcohol dehydrogenase family)